MIDIKLLAQKISDHFESDEGKASVKKYLKELEQKDEIERNQIERFHQKYGTVLDAVIERIMAKYDSNEYTRREHKLGYEPRTDLYFFLYKYAETYGKSTKSKAHCCDFNQIAYYIGSYVIRILNGQGAHAQIYKQ